VAEFYSGLSVNITPIHWWIIAPVFSENRRIWQGGSIQWSIREQMGSDWANI